MTPYNQVGATQPEASQINTTGGWMSPTRIYCSNQSLVGANTKYSSHPGMSHLPRSSYWVLPEHPFLTNLHIHMASNLISLQLFCRADGS